MTLSRVVVSIRALTCPFAAKARADHVERLARPPEADGLKGQLVEEMARLGCCLVEAAGALVERSRPEESGVFARQASFGDAE